MTGFRVLRLALLLSLTAGTAVAQPSAAPAISLTPAIVEAGSPELIRVTAQPGATLTGEWMGHTIAFIRGHDARTWFALAGMDVEAPVGPSTLQVTERLATGATVDLSRTVEIRPAHYRTTTLTVAPRFVEPGPAQLERIKAEIEIKKQVFASSAPEPLWHGSFHAPVRAAPTDSFGTRRVFNGTLDSVHKGMDFRARMRTPVRASNSGVVVLARPLYFEGGCVIIDHGLGLYTLSMHLSRIDVREGQRVVTGQLLGLSGATGRVTGPHLHWAVRWEDAYLDPAKLLRMNLNGVR